MRAVLLLVGAADCAGCCRVLASLALVAFIFLTLETGAAVGVDRTLTFLRLAGTRIAAILAFRNLVILLGLAAVLALFVLATVEAGTALT